MACKRKRSCTREYDGTTFRQIYRLGPHFLVPGLMLAVFSPCVLFVTWPFVTPVAAVAALGLVLIGCGLLKHRRFSVGPSGFVLSWSLGPFGWTTSAKSSEIKPFLKQGSAGYRVYEVMLRRGWRTLDPWIEVGSLRESRAWCSFLTKVGAGESAVLPDKDIIDLLKMGSQSPADVDQ